MKLLKSNLFCFPFIIISILMLTFTNLFALNLQVGNTVNNSVCPLKYVSPKLGGQNISPSVKWSNIPKGTNSYVLTCIDTNPIANNWVHWIVLDIPADVVLLPEGASRSDKMPSGSTELNNSFDNKGYGGPQPPKGTGYHDYVFTLYALKCKCLNLHQSFISDEKLLNIIKPYIIAKTEFVLRFK